ncbi:MAG: hypothetical protein KKH29_03285 [Candidatus Omnitrophica bacterium]|nr:hypothetical protein [Candidatus Omnitrophota bacterium]MBU4472598.1 hypothetical protein [Candidatus Omnitrophota bacterium]MCG2706256.1 hypothetical protein [Candidatus Omnitrophota bacterium]
MLVSGNAPLTTALIALALGYITCSLASKEKRILKTTGYIIGVFIIVISSLLLISEISRVAGKDCYKAKKMMMHEKMPIFDKQQLRNSLTVPELPPLPEKK